MNKLLFRKEKKPWNLQELIVICYSAIKILISGKVGAPAKKPAALPALGWYSLPISPTTRDIPLTILLADAEAKSVEVLVGQGAEAVRFIVPAGSDGAEAKSLYLILSQKRQELGLPLIKQIDLTDPGLNPVVRFALADSDLLDVVFDNCSSQELMNWTDSGWQKAAQIIKMTIDLNNYADHGLRQLVLLDSFEVQDKQKALLNAHRMINYAGIPPALIVEADSYVDALETMQISLKHEAQLIDHIVAHEMGHLLYGQWVSNDHALTQQFRKLFSLALGENRFELADDSNYLPVNDLVGHPFDDPGELFASFSAAYRAKPEQLVAFINDHSTPQLTRRLGIALWCLMRDRVYQGEVFYRDDPFRRYDLAEMMPSFTSQEVALSLKQATSSKNLLVAAAALQVLSGEQTQAALQVNPAGRSPASSR
jgi:hypothetical protein